MKSVKKYSKKKPRVQRNVQPRIQPRIQARSNKKLVNKKGNKGTKKVKSKSRKNTKKKYQSGGLIFPKKEKKPEKTIFFDVDGTLGDTRCNDDTDPNYDDEMREELLKLLDMLKKKGVKLFILTRCATGDNICRENQKDYYEPIVERMDGVFAADVLEIDIDNPLPGVDGGNVWAAIKSKVMEEYSEMIGLREEEKREKVILIDDDNRNAQVAYKRGFRAFHNNKSAYTGAALKMTNGALKKILQEMNKEPYFFSEDFIDVSTEDKTMPDIVLTDEIQQKIKNSIKKSKKVRCGRKGFFRNKLGKLVSSGKSLEKRFEQKNASNVDNDNDNTFSFVFVDQSENPIDLKTFEFNASNTYDKANLNDFITNELQPTEIGIYWSIRRNGLVAFFGLENTDIVDETDLIGRPIGSKSSRLVKPNNSPLTTDEISKLEKLVAEKFKLDKHQPSRVIRNELKISGKEIEIKKLLSEVKRNAARNGGKIKIKIRANDSVLNDFDPSMFEPLNHIKQILSDLEETKTQIEQEIDELRTALTTEQDEFVTEVILLQDETLSDLKKLEETLTTGMTTGMTKDKRIGEIQTKEETFINGLKAKLFPHPELKELLLKRYENLREIDAILFKLRNTNA